MRDAAGTSCGANVDVTIKVEEGSSTGSVVRWAADQQPIEKVGGRIDKGELEKLGAVWDSNNLSAGGCRTAQPCYRHRRSKSLVALQLSVQECALDAPGRPRHRDEGFVYGWPDGKPLNLQMISWSAKSIKRVGERGTCILLFLEQLVRLQRGARGLVEDDDPLCRCAGSIQCRVANLSFIVVVIKGVCLRIHQGGTLDG